MRLNERYEHVLKWFGENMPDVDTELHYKTPYQLLIAVVLSAQCTDKRVNMITPALFERFPTVEKMAGAEPEEIFTYIRSVSYPNSKAKYLSALARKLVEEYEGRVPSDLDALQTLPGVGRKTANVLGAVLYGKAVMPVDTHVFRVSARIGLTRNAKNPLQAEKQLTSHIPGELLPKAHHWLILHGRYVCTARNPKCTECGIAPWCKKVERDKRLLK